MGQYEINVYSFFAAISLLQSGHDGLYWESIQLLVLQERLQSLGITAKCELQVSLLRLLTLLTHQRKQNEIKFVVLLQIGLFGFILKISQKFNFARAQTKLLSSRNQIRQLTNLKQYSL